MDPKTDSFGGAPNIPVDTFIDHAMGLRPPGHYRSTYDYHVDELDQHAGAAVYQAKKIRPDKRAIENLDKLAKNLPKKPPGRR